MPEPILTNSNGVTITSKENGHGHYMADNAKCQCGDVLIVAPAIFQADHQKGDPVMVCGDHGVHAYRFSSLVIGTQPAEAQPSSVPSRLGR